MNKDSIYFNEYVDSNIPYKFEDYTSQSRQSKNFLHLGEINNYRYHQYEGRDRYNALFSNQTLEYISKEITKRLKGVHPEGKNIILPNDTIISVIDSIHTKTSNASLDVMVEMSINYIVNQIKSEYETTEKNNKLSVWTSNYTLDTGMQRFSDVKLNRKSRVNYTAWRY
jgi:hypothetical protein